MASTTASGLRPGEEKLFPGQPRGFPFGDFDVEDVMLPEGDDMGIPSDESDSGEPAPSAETGFGSVIGEFECGRGEQRRRTPRRSAAAAAGTAALFLPAHARTHTAHTPSLPPLTAVVDNLPSVPAEKHEKLCTVVRKVFSQIGPIVDGEKKGGGRGRGLGGRACLALPAVCRGRERPSFPVRATGNGVPPQRGAG